MEVSFCLFELNKGNSSIIMNFRSCVGSFIQLIQLLFITDWGLEGTFISKNPAHWPSLAWISRVCFSAPRPARQEIVVLAPEALASCLIIIMMAIMIVMTMDDYHDDDLVDRCLSQKPQFLLPSKISIKDHIPFQPLSFWAVGNNGLYSSAAFAERSKRSATPVCGGCLYSVAPVTPSSPRWSPQCSPRWSPSSTRWSPSTASRNNQLAKAIIISK